MKGYIKDKDGRPRMVKYYDEPEDIPIMNAKGLTVEGWIRQKRHKKQKIAAHRMLRHLPKGSAAIAVEAGPVAESIVDPSLIPVIMSAEEDEKVMHNGECREKL